MNNTLIAMATHYVNEAIVLEYKKMKNTPGVEAIMMINNSEFKFEFQDRVSEVTFFGIKVKCFFFDESLNDEYGLPYYPYDKDNFGKVIWYNPEYRFIYLRKVFPQYKYFWVIDNDVFCNSTDGTYSGFLSRFNYNEDDLIIANFRHEKKNSKWYWSHKLEWCYENSEIYAGLFSAERLSNKAIDFLYQKRLEHKKLYDSALGEKRWAICEVFVPTELMNNGFTCSDLGEPCIRYRPNFYLNDTRCFEKPDNKLYHPVKFIEKDLLVENATLAKKIRKLEAELKSNLNFSDWFTKTRIDIKNLGEGNDVNVTVLEGIDCRVEKVPWFSKGGTGYTLVAKDKYIVLELKCIGEGELLLYLTGINKTTSEEKRLPLWIDYNRLAVDKKIIFGEVKPQWHDKPYLFKKKVSDGEKVKVEISWSEHAYKGEELAKLLSMLCTLPKGN